MPTYTPTTWVDEIPASTPVKYVITDDTVGPVASSATIEVATAITSGTPLNATNLNNIESGITTAQATANDAIPKSLVTTIGDLIYATASGVLARLGIGANGTYLAAVAGQPQWLTPSVFLRWQNAAYNGNAIVVGTYTVNIADWIASYPNPTPGWKAAVIKMSARWAAASDGSTIDVRNSAGDVYVTCRSLVANYFMDGFGIVPLDSSGNFKICVYGANTNAVYINVMGLIR
jgi:hypothetical protein